VEIEHHELDLARVLREAGSPLPSRPPRGHAITVLPRIAAINVTNRLFVVDHQDVFAMSARSGGAATWLGLSAEPSAAGR